MRTVFGDAGYLLREGVLQAAEIEELRAVVEEVSTRVVGRAERDGAGPTYLMPDGHRVQMSSRTSIQWEWADGSRQIRLLEPCDHLHPRIAELFADERLVEPVRRELGVEQVGLFTSKLNFKRAREGSQFPWHQDYPYWYMAVREDAQDVVTAIVFLDDATADNGAIRAIPGSHRRGPLRRDTSEPTRSLLDAAAIDACHEVLLEAPAGSVLWFGAFLAHRSSPNRSGGHRRALLPSWQPAGRGRVGDFPLDPTRLDELP
jgi:ectoine hydroxylase-related dioxygenase (phytanoyl-CoA dioxygenase family)